MPEVRPFFPAQLWPGFSPDTQRASLDQNYQPSGIDWQQITQELIAVQQYVLDLGELAKVNITFKGEWDNGTTYEINDLVTYGGSSYLAIAQSTNDAPLSANWALLAQGGANGTNGESFHWVGVWDVEASYEIGDVVGYQGSAYIATAPSTGVTPTAAEWDLFAAKGADGTNGEDGADGADGDSFNWAGPWNDSTTYEEDDVVEHEGSTYIALNENTNSEPPSADWDLFVAKGEQGDQGADGEPGEQGEDGEPGEPGAPGEDGVSFIWRGPWSNVTAYEVNDAVEFGGSSYIAVSPSTDSAPPSADWDLMAQAGENGTDGESFRWQGEWSDSVDYEIGDVVRLDGSVYIATAPNTNDAPPSANWDLFATNGSDGADGADGSDGADGVSFFWAGPWASNISYAPNDAVEHEGSSYIALTTNNDSEPPSADWDLMAAKGDQGEQGEDGEPGEQGEPGEPGAPGADGADGVSFIWRGAWDSETTYQPNDVVEFGGSTYICVDETTGADPTLTPDFELMAAAGENGADGDDGADGSPGEKGDKGDKGDTGDKGDKGDDGDPGTDGADGQSFIWMGAWDAETAYAVDDVVEHDGSSYIAVAGNTGSEPPSADWELMAQAGSNGADGADGADGTSFTWQGEWSSETSYVVNDVVEWDGSTYIAILPSLDSEPPSADWDLVAAKGATGATGSTGAKGDKGDKGDTGDAGTNGTNGANGANGADGLNGGGVTLEYVFSTTTTDSDPGDGNLRLNNATQSSATAIRADLKDRLGSDFSAALGTLADSTSTVKGHIRLTKKTDATKWLLFTVSALASPSGYKNITVANVASSGSIPFSNADNIVLTFTRTGDKGDTGATGSNGTNGSPLVFTGVKTANYTAHNGDFVRCDDSGGSFTVTVPASPSAGWQFGVILTTGSTHDANTVTVSSGSGPHDNKLYCLGDYIIYQYDGSTWRTVDLYLRPHAGVIYKSSDATTNTANVPTKYAVDTAVYQYGNLPDTTNARINIARSGGYAVFFGYAPKVAAASNGWHMALLYQNGTEVFRNTSPSNGAAPVTPAVNILNLSCTAGDYIEAYFASSNANGGVTWTTASLQVKEQR